MGKKGLLQFEQLDPWHETKITRITGATFCRSNSILQHGYIVHDYLKQK